MENAQNKINRVTAPDRSEMVERAKSMTPKLAARAEDVEKSRIIHPQTVQDFWDTQLWTVVKPKRYGGLELDYGVFIDLSDYIARGCASTAWILSLIHI